MLERVNRGGLDLLIAGELEERGILVAFTGRDGGLSSGRYSSLNLSYNVGDNPGYVCSNRELVARATGLPIGRWVLCQQIHGAVVSDVGILEVGRGSRDYMSGLPRTDGLVTGLKDVALAVLTADCIPIVMAAPSGGVVAAVHAGWRGVLAGVAVIALRKMVKRGRMSAGEVIVFLGPHIMSCCMDTGEDIASEFRSRFGDDAVRERGDKRAHVDLEKAVRRQIIYEGVKERNVFSSGTCTSCGEGYFSFRASSGTCGRQGGFAALLDPDGGS